MALAFHLHTILMVMEPEGFRYIFLLLFVLRSKTGIKQVILRYFLKGCSMQVIIPIIKRNRNLNIPLIQILGRLALIVKTVMQTMLWSMDGQR